jgi:hypothetical protein
MSQPLIIAGILIGVVVIGYAVYQYLDEEMFREEGRYGEVRETWPGITFL